MLEILAITAPIFMIIAVGFTAVRLEFFSQSDTRALGMFVINFALPALIFKALSQRPFAEIMNVHYLLAYALGSLAVLSIGVSVAYFGQKKSLQASTLHGMGMSFSNSGFIGYPIALQLLGPPASVALALNLIVENMLMLPIALALAESGKNTGERLRSVLFKSFVRLLKNPIILSILAGSTFAIFEALPPEPITRVIDMFAMASAPAALFVIGGSLVRLKVKGIMGDVGQIMFGKLLLHPLAVFTALMLLPPIDPVLQIAAVTFACVPMLSIYPILGQRYGQEGLCAAALVTTTAASFISISGVLWIIEVSGVFAGHG